MSAGAGAGIREFGKKKIYGDSGAGGYGKKNIKTYKRENYQHGKEFL